MKYWLSIALMVICIPLLLWSGNSSLKSGGTYTNSAVTHAGGIVHIGDSGTISYADGSGDLFVEDELEVEGVAVFKALCRVTGGFQLGNFNDAAILLIDPNGIGEVYMSSEHSGIFVSTGTAAGEFGYIATTDLP